jgi:hypothetical protein
MIYNFDKHNFKELMKRKELHLPRRWNNGDFQRELKGLFDFYIRNLSSVVDQGDLKLIRRICRLVLKSVDHYYNGFTSNAFSTFSTVMELLMSRPFMIYQKSGQIITLNDIDELRLYRIRNVDENKIYTRKNIFHTPFNLRSKIGTCRYSIAGYPCLYLATNLELCVFETPKLNNSQITTASKFQIIRRLHDNRGFDIKVIELGVKPQHFFGRTQEDNFTNDIERTIDRLNEIDLEDPKIMSNYLLWYPVIAASSFIRVCKTDPFASEYIVPQLIMEWIRLSAKKEEYYGIRYFSCANERASEIGMNYVFPAYYDKSSNDSHCRILANVFRLTEPVMLHNYLGESDCQQYLDNCNELDKISP